MTTHTRMNIISRLHELLALYGLGPEFIDRLSAVGGSIWGSAAVHCCIDRPTWQPADLDILVATTDQAAAISDCLRAAGYEAGIKTTVRDVGLFGYEDDVRTEFAQSIDKVIVHQQWRDGIVQMGAVVSNGRIRRVVKIYVGRPAAADLDICESRITFGDEVIIRNTVDGPLAHLQVSLFDLSTDDMRRLEKWRGRGFMISGF